MGFYSKPYFVFFSPLHAYNTILANKTVFLKKNAQTIENTMIFQLRKNTLYGQKPLNAGDIFHLISKF